MVSEPDDILSGKRGTRGKRNKKRKFEFERAQDAAMMRKRPRARHQSKIPMPVAPPTASGQPPLAVDDHALATMLANISNYSFASSSPFQPDVPLRDKKLQCPVCKGRFVQKQGNIMRQHQDVTYGGICRGSEKPVE